MVEARTYNVRKILSPSSSLPLLAKTITHPAARSLCDSWASCLVRSCCFTPFGVNYYRFEWPWPAIRLHTIRKRAKVCTHQFKVIHRCSSSNSQVFTTHHKGHLRYKLLQEWQQLPTTLPDLNNRSLSSLSSVNQLQWSSRPSSLLRPWSVTSSSLASPFGVASVRVDSLLSF